ncbi:hypothetical protein VA249_25060 [Vibrio alfacsensis]|uniref:DUF7033 domain-containing protein n=1 Tax=Vibrio alfacsensis TaxID=1074311 RepID=UPI001BED72C3|nr:hypothetical protein [Vibrio alfacsensis]BBM65860.1 hypothetical protein VA249_25060 [Vibrio alfacsensis]
MSHFFTDTKLNWLESILYERFGHKLLLNQQGKHLRMVLQGSDKEIIFDQLQGVFHQSCSNFSCYEWDAFSQGYQTPISNLLPAPSVSPLPERLIEYHPEGASIHYDILGLTFWMLTRLEEVGSGELDKHQRFPATASHAYKHNYLERPVVDEWLIILGQVIQRVWQGVSLKRNQYCVKVSHDVDIPSLYGFKPWPKIARMMAGHLLKRCDMKSFFKAPYVKIATVNRLHSADPYNTFDWLMDISDSYNLKSAFYFICGGNHQFDADYQPEHPAIRNLMRHIHGRGHEVGLHPSYDSFKEPEVIKQQADRLKQICIEEGIKQTEWGGECTICVGSSQQRCVYGLRQECTTIQH